MDFLRNKNLIKLVGHFEKMGYQIRIVGGAVRDALQNLPCKDIDLCTDADPNEMMELAEKFSLNVIPTGLQHGTVTFVINGEPFEVTTLRIDVETDGRHAQVEYTRDFELDAQRRDLTFNAMSMDMDGNIYDYFNGQDDLKRNRIRFVGNAADRISEDYLRVLRWFRFASRGINFPSIPDFQHEYLLFKDYNTQAGLSKISGERIWSELKKILVAKHNADTIKTMIDTNVISSVSTNHLSFRPATFSEFTRKVLRETNVINGWGDEFADMKEAMVMAALATVVGIENSDKVIERLKFSAKERKYFEFMTRWLVLVQHPQISYTQQNAGLNSWFYFQVAEGQEPQLLMAALVVAEVFSHYTNSVLKNVMTVDGKVHYDYPMIPFPITGKDLMDAGVKPGPTMGHLLRAFRADWSLPHRGTVGVEYCMGILKRFKDPSKIYSMKITKKSVEEFMSGFKTRSADGLLDSNKAEHTVLDAMAANEPEFYFAEFEMQPYGDDHFLVFFKDKESAMVAKLQESIFASAR